MLGPQKRGSLYLPLLYSLIHLQKYLQRLLDGMVFPALFLTVKYLFLIFVLYFYLLAEVLWYVFTDSHTWDQSF